MTKYKVNQEGVDALNECCRALKGAMSELEMAAVNLKTQLAANSDGAGPHYDEIEEIAEQLSRDVQDLQDPVDEVSEKLANLAESYEDIIGDSLS